MVSAQLPILRSNERLNWWDLGLGLNTPLPPTDSRPSSHCVSLLTSLVWVLGRVERLAECGIDMSGPGDMFTDWCWLLLLDSVAGGGAGH